MSPAAGIHEPGMSGAPTAAASQPHFGPPQEAAACDTTAASEITTTITTTTTTTTAATTSSSALSSSKRSSAQDIDQLQPSPKQLTPTTLSATSDAAHQSKPTVISPADVESNSSAGTQPQRRQSVAGNPTPASLQQQQWLAQVAAQTHHEVRQRMSQAGDQLNLSIRQIYASASSIAAEMPPSYHNIPGIVPFNQGRSIGPPPSYDDVINPYAPPPTYQSLFGQMCEARKRSRGLIDLLSRLFIILVSTLGCTILIAFMILIPFTMIIVGAAYIDECRIEHIPAFLLVGGLVWASKSLLHCYSQCRQMPSVETRSELGLNDIYLSASSMSLSSSGSGSSSAGGPAGSSADFLEPREATVEAAVAVGSATTPGGLTSELQLGHTRERRANQNSRANHWTHSERAHRSHRRRRASRLYDTSEDDAHSSRLKSSICESLLNCVLFGWFIAGCVIVFRNYEPDFENPLSPCYCHKTVYMYTFWLITSAILLLGLFIGCICCLIVSSAVASHREEIEDELA